MKLPGPSLDLPAIPVLTMLQYGFRWDFLDFDHDSGQTVPKNEYWYHGSDDNMEDESEEE